MERSHLSSANAGAKREPLDRVRALALEQVRFEPLVIEAAMRAALNDAIAWRIGGGSAPAPAALVGAAVAGARLRLDGAGAGPPSRSRTLALVAERARSFAASTLGRRLMTIPTAQFLRLTGDPDGADVVVRDRYRRLHAIRLVAQADAFESGRIAKLVEAQTPVPRADRLFPLTIHVYALASGRRHTFEHAAFRTRRQRVSVRVA